MKKLNIIILFLLISYTVSGQIGILLTKNKRQKFIPIGTNIKVYLHNNTTISGKFSIQQDSLVSIENFTFNLNEVEAIIPKPKTFINRHNGLIISTVSILTARETRVITDNLFVGMFSVVGASTTAGLLINTITKNKHKRKNGWFYAVRK